MRNAAQGIGMDDLVLHTNRPDRAGWEADSRSALKRNKCTQLPGSTISLAKTIEHRMWGR